MSTSDYIRDGRFLFLPTCAPEVLECPYLTNAADDDPHSAEDTRGLLACKVPRAKQPKFLWLTKGNVDEPGVPKPHPLS